MTYPRATPVYTLAYDLVLDGRGFFDLLNTGYPDGRPFSPDTSRLPDDADRARLVEQAAAVTAALGKARARPDLAVSIVLPQAGSLRRMEREDSLFERWLDTTILVTEALVAAGAGVEIIGYTTVGWRGGRAAEEWRTANSPLRPGRLCDLLHIVYKAFDEAWTPEARHLLDLGARTGYMRENVDGEAYDFAAARLIARQSASERALLVFSKGLSVEDTTTSWNGGDGLLDSDRAAALEHARKAGIRLACIEDDDGLARASDFAPDEIRFAGRGRGTGYDVTAATLAVLAPWLARQG